MLCDMYIPHPESPPHRPNAHPLTDGTEVRECRRILGEAYESSAAIEMYDSAAELGAARDLELWGCNPFEED